MSFPVGLAEEKPSVFTTETLANDLEKSGATQDDKPINHVKVDEKISWWTSLRQNPKAFGWCCYMLFTCIMWGYDGLASAIVLSIPKFREDYGRLWHGQYVVSANWQLAFTAASMIGLMLGGICSGLSMKHVGQRWAMAVGYVFTTAGVFLQWYSPGHLAMLFGGKLLTGIPLGVFLTTAPVYCSEVAPPSLRGAMIAAVNWSIVIGQLLSYGVMRQTQSRDDSMSYRIMFAVQWGFAGVGAALLPFCPESPMRLLARHKLEDAKTSIARLYNSDVVDSKVAEIQALLAHEAGLAANAGTWLDCFKGTNRLRTLIACSVFFLQANSGVSWVVGYMGYFMQLGGMKPKTSFDLNVGVTGLMAVGCMCGWVFVEKIGRRLTILIGLIACTVCLLVIGILTQFIDHGSTIVYTQVGFMAVWGFMYQASIGGVGYTLISEVPASSVRSQTQGLATATNGLFSSVWSFALPYMINPDEANMGGNVAFLFFGCLVVGDIFVYFAYPETKGRSFEEIDELFNRGVRPRDFAKTKLN
ncbi:hypothetical protein PV08_06768 [Exophiala spinifera]|uniref:Major facilitator superfamily (MFS) profile domain-containing protein n=1 Tax=Exophiala spinifera TaxID=91928 RepID=A0A0D1ZMG8_9EURO|nr:uncharacterized protein PV08_06768 [Exophiala spinifera]KIW13987.1 hypothetical protein PV08_06768 [Exophiala spinifera]